MDLINRATQGNTASPVVINNIKVLTNPMRKPAQVVLSGQLPAGSARSYIFFDDALTLASSDGLVSATNGAAMTTSTYTAAIFKQYLLTHALIVSSWNFDTTKSSEIAKNMQLLYGCIDGDGERKTLFTAQQKSNMQNDPNLLNIGTPFVWTFNCALKLGMTPDPEGGDTVVDTLTFNIAAACPYAELTELLAALAIPDRAMNK